MRKLLAFLLVLVLVFSLAGCKKDSAEELPADDTQQEMPEKSEENTHVTDETPADTTEDEQETKPEENKDTQDEQETEQEQEAALPYTEKIVRADQSVFDGPGYDANYVGVVEEAGVYTIVEEATDDEGNLWGKLKSGRGWVDLTDIRTFNWPVSANFADEKLLESGNYHFFADETHDYVVDVAFRAYEVLSFVTVYPLELTDDGLVAGEAVLYLEELTPDKPMVVELSFPGDMSQYAIEFTTEQGAETYFCVYISGRNGMLVLDETIGSDSVSGTVEVSQIWGIEDEYEFVLEMDLYVAEKCNYGENLDALTDAERVFYITQTLEMEVNNGGFWQFLYNAEEDVFCGVVSAFVEIGAEKTAELCQQAIDAFDFELPTDKDARRRALEKFGLEDGYELLEVYDEEFCAYDEDLNSLNYMYIQNNKDDFR